MALTSAILLVITLTVQFAHGTELQNSTISGSSSSSSISGNGQQEQGPVNGLEINQAYTNVDRLFEPDKDLSWLQSPLQPTILSEPPKLEVLASENLQASLPGIVGAQGSEQLFSSQQQPEGVVPQYDSTHLLMTSVLPTGKRRFDDNAALASTGQSRGNQFIIPTDLMSVDIDPEFKQAIGRLDEQARLSLKSNKRASRGQLVVDVGPSADLDQQQQPKANQNYDRRSLVMNSVRSSGKSHGVRADHHYQEASKSSRNRAKSSGNYRQESRKQPLKRQAANKMNYRQIQGVSDDDIFKDEENNNDDGHASRGKQQRRASKRLDHDGSGKVRFDDSRDNEHDNENDSDNDSASSGADEDDEDDEASQEPRASSKRTDLSDNNSIQNSRTLQAQLNQHDSRHLYHQRPQFRQSGQTRRKDVVNEDDTKAPLSLGEDFESEENIDSTNLRKKVQDLPDTAYTNSDNNQLNGVNFVVHNTELPLEGLAELSGKPIEAAVTTGDDDDEAYSAASHLKNSAADLQAAAGHHHGGHDGHYYQFVEVPKKKAWKFGFKRGNHKHTIERHEKGYKNKFHSSFKWHAKERCKKKKCESKGKMVWHYEHHDKKHHR